MIFRIRDAGGYNPSQLVRYWTFVRAMDPKNITYNAAFLSGDASPAAFDLLQVGWMTAATASQDVPGSPPAAVTDGAWSLFPAASQPPLASALTSWSVAGSPGAALAAVRADGFDPDRTAVLEQEPGVAQAPSSKTFGLTPRMEGTQAVRIDVWRDGPSVVLLRVPYATGWHVAVDGHAATVLHADYVDMGVAVPAGTHTIEFTYDDPRVGYGLLGSGLAVALLEGAANGTAVVGRRRRRRRRTDGGAEGAQMKEEGT